MLAHAREVLGRAPATQGGAQSRGPKRKIPVDELGPASAKWDYLARDGTLIAFVYRYDPQRVKEFRPSREAQEDRAAGPASAYNQPGIAAADMVVLTEGEKCAQALITIGICATTAMHGANAPVDKTDWTPLAGKRVLIWPDRDKPGWEYAERASHAILATGAASCFILYPPEDKPEGWDAADAIAEGFDVQGYLVAGQGMPIETIGKRRRSRCRRGLAHRGWTGHRFHPPLR